MADMAQQATGQPQERDNQQRNENKTKAPKTSFEKHVVVYQSPLSFVRSATDRAVEQSFWKIRRFLSFHKFHMT